MSSYISNAVSFINNNMPQPCDPVTITFGTTPEYTRYDSCYFLLSWNISDEQKKTLPRACFCYFLLWDLKDGDSPCWGGGTLRPSLGINNRAICSAPYNVWWWADRADWGHGLRSGEAIMIHELHHAFESMLHDVYGYPISKSMKEHEYGKTIPHVDFMADFGFKSGEDYEFTAWAYTQITKEMCDKLDELCIEAPPTMTRLSFAEQIRGKIDFDSYPLHGGYDAWSWLPNAECIQYISSTKKDKKNYCIEIYTSSQVKFYLGAGQIDEMDQSICNDALSKLVYERISKVIVTVNSVPPGASITIN